MQVQRINPYQTYSSNRVQRPEAKNPNFGLKLTLDGNFVAEVKKLAGDAGFQQVQRQLEIMGKDENLISRFQNIFSERIQLQKLFGTHEVPRECKSPDGCNINPAKLFVDWESLEAKLIVEDFDDSVAITCLDSQRVNAFKTYPKEINPVSAIIGALSDTLNEYAANKIMSALSVLKVKQ